MEIVCKSLRDSGEIGTESWREKKNNPCCTVEEILVSLSLVALRDSKNIHKKPVCLEGNFRRYVERAMLRLAASYHQICLNCIVQTIK